MNTAIKMTLAAALAAASFVPLAHAAEVKANEHVSIVYIDTLNEDGDDGGTFTDLTNKAAHPDMMAGAQAEAKSDQRIATKLKAHDIKVDDVVQIDTAANGGKIVYVR